jgi:hypothetical protein
MIDWTIGELLRSEDNPARARGFRVRPKLSKWQKNPFLRHGRAVQTADVVEVVDRVHAIWQAGYGRKRRRTRPTVEEVASAYLAGWRVGIQPRQVHRYRRDSSRKI